MSKEPRMTPRQVALRVLCVVDAADAYVHIALDNYLRRTGLDKRDRRLVTELVYGTLRRRLTLDWVLARFSRYTLESMTVPLRNNLRMAVYQILFLDSIPAAAVCHEAVELTKSFGHDGMVRLVNGILRSLLRDPEKGDYQQAAQTMGRAQGISLLHSHPLWLVEHWLRELGPEETEELCAANNLSPPTFVRANTLKVDRDRLIRELQEAGLTAGPGRLAPESVQATGFSNIAELEAFRLGHFVVQDEASMLPAHVLAPRPGELIYDLCAGLGGKTLHMAALMENEGRILAFDIHRQKLEVLGKTAKKLGITNVNRVQADVANLDMEFWGKAQGVLLDAPCSGWGVIRRKPDIRWRSRPDKCHELISLQRQLLVSAYYCLEPGGRMVYSTCTVNRGENEDNIAWLQRKYRDLECVDIKDCFPSGVEIYGDVPDRTLQLLPHRHGTDGFFVAVLKKGSRS